MTSVADGLHLATRDELSGLPLAVAPHLLGAILRVDTPEGAVAIRITEVEAYHGRGTGEIPDPGSHARMGRTDRNATMWGEPGHLYVYLSHGIHSCVNVVCGPEGIAGGVLLRAGEVIEGADVARRRRQQRKPGADGVVRCAPSIADRDLARGPGRFGQAIGLRHPADDGVDAVSGGPVSLYLRDDLAPGISTGPRVGVAGVAGTGAYPWRFFLAGDPTVSVFRAGRGAVEAAATG
ncbi:DNA-3-methyladenine glycosylase [Microbacterium sp. ZW T5_56]|uniref:DNA-3-methyladenine glycosylase n=1 Tax=Microbacterium sp. ZW T5_56 TaxID=3378081 RepID=UPI0038522C50